MRTSPRAWRAVVLVLLAVPILLAPPSRAEDEDAADEDELGRPIPDEEARTLLVELDKVARKDKADDVLPTLEKIGLRTHACLQKSLVRLVGHDSSEVALRALDILAVQRFEKPRDAAKLADQVWKAAWSNKANEKRYGVQARGLRAVAALEGSAVEERRIREVQRLWRWLTGNPHRDHGVVLEDVCRYVRQTKDKRLCRLLAEEIDEPMATDVNSGTNPPAEWWQRRWEMWMQAKAACVEALQDLTGQTFKTTADAKAWFEAHEKEFGFRW